MNKQEIEKAISNINYGIHYEDCGNMVMVTKFSATMAISALNQQLNNRWIPVSEKLPGDDNPVEVTARRKEGARGYFVYKAHYIAPHTKTTEDFGWDSDYTEWEYDEENDCYWIPECWYEDNAIADNGNYILDDEFDILAWKTLSEPWKETV